MHSNTHIPSNGPGHRQRSSDDDGTYVGEELSAERVGRPRAGSHLTVNTVHEGGWGNRSIGSPSQTREQASRLDDDLALLQIERQISNQEALNREQSQNRSVRRERSRRDEPVDAFDEATNPLHEKTALYKPPENPATTVSKFFKKVHNSIWLVRYFVYIAPLVLIILIPLLLGALVFPNASVGGVELVWFCIWLEIIWLTLWAGRVGLNWSSLLNLY
jgi:hypothetical protein